ncbi:MAG: hypothetical protein OXT72_01170 [Gammaproteobacteria bacterium]|nr:hypothetical protein [Gammaproteobacteria bacterium]MDE0249116.1 hypothetical protein [Gammaproteobacteria bacterium]
MTSHPTEAIILSVRDGEPVAEEVLAHLDECAACARALKEARDRAGTIENVLAVLTVPAQAPGETAVAERPPVGRMATGRRGRMAAPSRPWASRGGFRTPWWLGRAALLLLIVAGALSALPGPFAGWIPRIFSGASPPEAPPAAAPELPGQVGGRMAVSSGPVAVRLESVPTGTVVDVRRAADGSVGVLAAAGSEFSYGEREVRASIAAGPVTVELPEGLVPATLIVNGGVYLVLDAAGMEVMGPSTTPGEASLATFRVQD